MENITINRAPVLTLWASVVAERLGHDHATALTLGKAVAGLGAQAKGRSLGIYKKPGAKSKQPKAKKRGEELRIDILSQSIPAVETEDGIRAVAGEKAINPDAVQSYLVRSFGDSLADVRSTMMSLAKSFRKNELAAAAYGLYEQFRPSIPSGVRGWGAQGELDLKLIRSLRQ